MLDRRYEVSMDKKERRKFEREKLRRMGGKEKLEYLWMYYKIWLLVPVVFIFLAGIGIQMYQNAKQETLIQVSIVDSVESGHEKLSEAFKKQIGKTGKNQVVMYHNNVTSQKGYSSQALMTTLMGAQSLDVLICPEEMYEGYNRQGAFQKVLKLEQTKSLQELLGISYEGSVYTCILTNAKETKHAEAFLKLLESASN